MNFYIGDQENCGNKGIGIYIVKVISIFISTTFIIIQFKHPVFQKSKILALISPIPLLPDNSYHSCILNINT